MDCSPNRSLVSCSYDPFSSMNNPDFCKAILVSENEFHICTFTKKQNGALIKKKFTCFSNWPSVDFSFLCIMGNKALGKTRIFARLPKINIFFNGKLTSKVFYILVMVWPPTVHSHVQSAHTEGENLSAMNVQFVQFSAMSFQLLMVLCEQMMTLVGKENQQG